MGGGLLRLMRAAPMPWLAGSVLASPSARSKLAPSNGGRSGCEPAGPGAFATAYYPT